MIRYRFILFFGLLLPGVLLATQKTVVPEGSVLTLSLNDYLSTKLNNEGDSFTAEVVSPVSLGDHLLIPKGSTVTGSISRIVRPGRFRGKAVMNLIFHSIRIPGKGQLHLSASLSRVGSAGTSEEAGEGTIEGAGTKGRDVAQVAKSGAAGAAIGALIGRGRGAAVGGGVGAAAGLASVLTTRGKDLEVRRGSTLQVVLDRPLQLANEP